MDASLFLKPDLSFEGVDTSPPNLSIPTQDLFRDVACLCWRQGTAENISAFAG